MARCPSCGAEAPAGNAFCGRCGQPLPATEVAEPSNRRVVTVLFVDAVGSTEVGEHTDPERVRPIMERYFAISRGVIERHGGTVEKFIGDAVMAVFGVPVLHEDDALRAVRAAIDVRRRLSEFGAESAAAQGIELSYRIGLCTGEVVVGRPRGEGTLVTGDAVNTAARLEAAAEPGSILLAESTRRLVRKVASTEFVGEVKLKGKEFGVRAYRVLAVPPLTALVADRPIAPTVGRSAELGSLMRVYRNVEDDGHCRLFTIIGAGGVGKSRLVRDFLATISPGSRVVRGRCLPYGEGITWWPVIELVRSAAGVLGDDAAAAAMHKLQALLADEPDGEVVAKRVGSITQWTEDDASATRADLFWGVRRLLEAMARRKPLIVVFDDLQWGDSAFLDLVEHIAEWSQDSAVLLLCMARPELLDARPTWAGGRLNSTTLLLEVLSRTEATELIDHLIGEGTLDAASLSRMLDAAEGNPLFVEEIVGMLADEGALVHDAAGWRADRAIAETISTPPSISALLAARLDQLPAAERALAQRASVIGRLFERSAVTHLTPEPLRPEVHDHLQGLTRRQLIGRLPGDEVYRFRHLLIRDAAYAALSKTERASLHERFADWLEHTAGDRIAELEAVLGYHLEQAHAHLVGLGLPDEHARAVAARAGKWLSAAGRRADEQRNASAALSLLPRALALLPGDDPETARAETALGSALLDSGDVAGGVRMLDSAVEHALDPNASVRARLYRLIAEEFRGNSHSRGDIHELAVLVRAAARLTDAGIQCDLRREASSIYRDLGDHRRAEAWARRALRYSARLGGSLEANAKLDVATLGLAGEMRLGDVTALCEEVISSSNDIAGRARALEIAALAYAQKGYAEEGRRALADARRGWAPLGVFRPNSGLTAGLVELAAGAPADAEERFRETLDEGTRQGTLGGFAAYLKARIAQTLVRQGRFGEAEDTASRALADDAEDAWTTVVGGGALAHCLAHRGSVDDALALTEHVEVAASLSGLAENPIVYGMSLEDRAAVLHIAGRHVDALEALEEALQRYQTKEATAFVQQLLPKLSEAGERLAD